MKMDKEKELPKRKDLRIKQYNYSWAGAYFVTICVKDRRNFQRGYIEHIIRDKEDYETRAKYIYENPMRWYYDELYFEE